MMEDKKVLNDDKVAAAAAIGALSTIISDIVSYILVLMGYGKYDIYVLNGFSITITGNRPSLLMGLIINFITGAILGILIYLALKKWGDRYTVIICCSVSAVMWLLWENVFTAYIENKTVPLRPVSDYYVHLIGSLAYGLTLGLMMKNIIFNKKQPNS